MAGRRSTGKRIATAAALTLPLWLVCCAPGSDPSASRGFPAGATTVERSEPAQAPLVPLPQPQAPPPAATAPPPESPAGKTAGTQTVTAYYVLLDDGGSGGVRFGCNDSLAGVRRSAPGSTEPLAAAMRALLDGSAQPAPRLYNALSGSTLTFQSGAFDGSTVTIYLSGSIRSGGVCDIPRIQAQLTQTAIASVGAIRAEVYVNGVGLSEALSLK